MLILVPWKPVAVVLGLLSALIFIGYFGTALAHGKDPFAVSTGGWLHERTAPAVNQRVAARKHAAKEPTESPQ